MNNVFKIIVIATVLSLGSASALLAQPANPAPLETITPDARAAGMADIGSATSPDVFSQHWNVAKYAFAKDTAAVGLAYTLWMPTVDFSTNLLYAAGYYKFGKQTISASIRYLTNGSSDFTGSSSDSYDNMSLNEFAFDLGYSRTFGNYFSLGAAARYLSLPKADAIGNDLYAPGRTSAFAVDLGVYFRYPSLEKNEFAMGLTLKNIGTKVSVSSETKLFLPMTMLLGGRYSIAIPNKHFLSFAAEISKPLVPEDQTDESVIGGLFSSFGNSIKEWGISLGVEYAYNQHYFARTGYHLGSAEFQYGGGSYFSVGGGAKWSTFTLDVSYMLSTSSNKGMSNSIRAALQYAF